MNTADGTRYVIAAQVEVLHGCDAVGRHDLAAAADHAGRADAVHDRTTTTTTTTATTPIVTDSLDTTRPRSG